jgi:integrase|tara:strand:- start:4762 stop:5718 length:957 start_codon:yes stop_codon:yes gene_type:complete
MAHIRRRGSSWQSIVRVHGYPPITKTFKTKIDAIRYSRNLEHQLFRDKHDIAKKKFPKFRDVLIRYRDEIVINKRSKEMETKLIKYMLSEGFVNYAINLVDRSLIAQYRDRALRSLKSSSVNRRLAILSHCFTIAKKEWGYDIDNPVLSIRRPTNPEPRDRRFTTEELDKIFSCNRTNPHMKFIIRLALETGMRRSEIANIKPQHLKGKLLMIPVAKTKPRTIPLTPKAIQLLQDNLPIKMSSNAIRLSWVRLTKKHGIEDARFHDLRHESLSRMFEVKSLNVPEVQLISGHLEPRTLMRVYANLRPKDLADKLAKME